MTALNFSRGADKLKKHRLRLKEFIRLFTQSKRFRIVLYTAGSLTLNVAYAAYNGVLGLFYGSIWFMILGVYYGLLAVMRYMAVSYEKKLDKGIQVVSEVYVMRFTGMMFIVMSVVLMLIELYSMIHNTARQYARLVIASIAVYTIIKLTRAIINLIYKSAEAPFATSQRYTKHFSCGRRRIRSYSYPLAYGICNMAQRKR